jgi:hypothetical protein
MKYRYLEKVKVVKGFYTGQEGLCIAYQPKNKLYQIEITRMVQERDYSMVPTYTENVRYKDVAKKDIIIVKEEDLQTMKMR